MFQYNRIASLTIVSNDKAEAKLIDGLKIKFDVKKSKDKSFNDAKIEVYNLSPETSEMLNEDKTKIILHAGYDNEQSTSVVFRGDVVRSYVVRKLPDVVTVIEAIDSLEAATKKISVGYSSKASGKGILNDIAKIAGIEVNKASSVNDKQQKNGFSATGLVKDIASKIADFLDLDLSFQNETLKYYPKGNADNEEVRALSSGTGLLESPVKIGGIDTKKKNKKSKKITGWKIKSLLIPDIEPGNKVVVYSDMLSGEVFSVATVNHSGDTFGDEWFSELEVEEIKGVSVKTPEGATFA